MSCERTTVRRAHKERTCGDPWCPGGGTIRPGDLYYEHVTGPGNEFMGSEHWLRMAECCR